MCAVDTLRSQHAIHLSGLVAGFVRVLGGWVFGAVFRLTMVLLLDWCVYMFFAGWTQTTQPGFCARPGTPAGVGCNS